MLKKLINRIICRLKGHNYASAYFDNYTLSFCTRCNKEIADRGFNDIDPLPDDYQFDIDDFGK